MPGNTVHYLRRETNFLIAGISAMVGHSHGQCRAWHYEGTEYEEPWRWLSRNPGMIHITVRPPMAGLLK